MDNVPDMMRTDVTPLVEMPDGAVGEAVLDAPEGFKFGSDFLNIVPIPGVDSDAPPDAEAMTAAVQARVVLRTNEKLDAYDKTIFDMPRRRCLTHIDFDLPENPRLLAQKALAGDPASFRKAARALYLFQMLMKQDKEYQPVVGINGRPYRPVIQGSEKFDQEGNVVARQYGPPKMRWQSRWDSDATASYGVKSGFAPLPGFWYELVKAGWLTHVLPNLQFLLTETSQRIGEGQGKVPLERVKARLDPERTLERGDALRWLAAAKQAVDNKLAKATKVGKAVK